VPTATRGQRHSGAPRLPEPGAAETLPAAASLSTARASRVPGASAEAGLLLSGVPKPDHVTFEAYVESRGGHRLLREEVDADGGAVADHPLEGHAVGAQRVVEDGGLVRVPAVDHHPAREDTARYMGEVSPCPSGASPGLSSSPSAPGLRHFKEIMQTKIHQPDKSLLQCRKEGLYSLILLQAVNLLTACSQTEC